MADRHDEQAVDRGRRVFDPAEVDKVGAVAMAGNRGAGHGEPVEVPRADGSLARDPLTSGGYAPPVTVRRGRL